MHSLHDNARLYRAAQTAAHAARIFVSSVFFARVLVHINEGASVVAPLALAAVAFIVAPAALGAVRARR